MFRLARVFLVAVAALAVVAAAGCGSGGDPATYVKDVNKAQTAFNRGIVRTQRDMTATSSAAANAQTLSRFVRDIGRTEAALRKTSPPDDVKDLNDQLIREVEQFGATVAGAQKQFASNQPKQIVAAQTTMGSSIARVAAQINATITKINDKLH